MGQSNNATTWVHAVRQFSGQKKRTSKEASRTTKSETTKECWNCGRQHGRQPKELCAAFGKTCDSCGKQNHARKCRQKRTGSTRNSVRAIGEPDEVFPVREVATLLDDSHVFALHRSFVRSFIVYLQHRTQLHHNSNFYPTLGWLERGWTEE